MLALERGSKKKWEEREREGGKKEGEREILAQIENNSIQAETMTVTRSDCEK